MVALITRAELASSLGQPDVDDAQADLAIDYGSAWVEEKTGWAFTPRTATIVLPAAYGYELALPLKPIRSITEVSIAGVAVTSYELTGAGTALALYGWWGDLVDVTLAVAYGTTTTPDSIKGVVAEVAGAVYEGRLGVANERVDDYAVSYTGVLSNTSRSTLAHYGASVGSVPVSRQ